MLLRKLYFIRKVLKQQWMKENDFKNLQNRKARSIVRHAFQNVPFYRKKWKEAGVRLEDIKTVEDLDKLPIVTRKEILQNLDFLIAENLKRWYYVGDFVKRATSGTTGNPLEMVFDKRCWDYYDAVYLRALMAAGYNPRKPLVYYWHEKFKPTLYNRLGFMNKIFIKSSLSEDEQLNILQRLNTEYIYYFGGILFSIAKKMNYLGIEIKPKVLITHAEVLSKRMRSVIEKAFNTEVFDQYGTTEFDRLGWECDLHTGYHVDADSIHLQILKDNEQVSAGEKGSVVITGFSNFLLPLIRYDIGDLAVVSSEKCGCG